MFERFLPSRTGGARPGARSRSGEPGDVFELMERFMRSPLEGFGPGGNWPSLDVVETDEEVVVTAEMPGLEAGDIDLTVENDTLTLRGEKRREVEEEKAGLHRMERSYGSFSRTVALPVRCDPDKVAARYKKGVLSVRLKKAPEAVARRVEIEP